MGCGWVQCSWGWQVWGSCRLVVLMLMMLHIDRAVGDRTRGSSEVVCVDLVWLQRWTWCRTQGQLVMSYFWLQNTTRWLRVFESSRKFFSSLFQAVKSAWKPDWVLEVLEFGVTGFCVCLNFRFSKLLWLRSENFVSYEARNLWPDVVSQEWVWTRHFKVLKSSWVY